MDGLCLLDVVALVLPLVLVLALAASQQGMNLMVDQDSMARLVLEVSLAVVEG